MAAPLGPDQKAAIRCLVDQGIISGREIGRRLGIGHVACGRYAERYLREKAEEVADEVPEVATTTAAPEVPTVDEIPSRNGPSRLNFGEPVPIFMASRRGVRHAGGVEIRG